MRKRKGYLSHLPVLRCLASLLQPKIVIEFGSGLYSTSMFLNKKIYDKLEILYSYETKKSWFDLIGSKFKDERLKLELMSSDIDDVEKQKFSHADLVFLDGPRKHRHRIMKNLSRLSDVFVLHDGPKKHMITKYLLKKTCNFKNICVYAPKKNLPTTVIFSNLTYKRFKIKHGKCFYRKSKQA